MHLCIYIYRERGNMMKYAYEILYPHCWQRPAYASSRTSRMERSVHHLHLVAGTGLFLGYFREAYLLKKEVLIGTIFHTWNRLYIYMCENNLLVFGFQASVLRDSRTPSSCTTRRTGRTTLW